jgi:hypothetical protein
MEIQAKVIDSHYLLPKCASKCVCMCVSEWVSERVDRTAPPQLYLYLYLVVVVFVPLRCSDTPDLVQDYKQP